LPSILNKVDLIG